MTTIHKTANTVYDLEIGESLSERERQSVLGQFLTPAPVADFMAGLFDEQRREVELLDAGAGDGALTAAFVRSACNASSRPEHISVTAYELDPILQLPLQKNLAVCRRLCERAGILFDAQVHNENFVSAVVPMVRDDLFASSPLRFNVAIVNPPYRKIRSDSPERVLLRSAGIETSNLYTGFLALIIRLLDAGGELVAITPRSFCNGPYFKPFRADFLKTMSLRRLHVFDSRSAAFSRDEVLQENVIVHAVKNAVKPRHVVVSSSSGEPGASIGERNVAYCDVVSPDDPELFIHLLLDERQNKAKSDMGRLTFTLADLGLTVSTGRVVDFRAAPYLRSEPAADTAPLIYPCHFNGGVVQWPKMNSRKPNAIVSNELTRDLLVPAGVYVLVKRFTSKEERRRVVACLYAPAQIPAPLVGFENHLNYFHVAGQGLPMLLAKGLAVFLNSSVVNTYFRQFSGHTQVNATDLRSLRYPSKDDLLCLGHEMGDSMLEQEKLDALIEETLF